MYMCMLFLIISVLFLLFLIAVNILILIQIVPGTTDVAGGMNIVLRIFTILLALLSVVAKKETALLSQYILILEDWKGSGLLDVLYLLLSSFFSFFFHRFTIYNSSINKTAWRY
jgi:hypothetical protein